MSVLLRNLLSFLILAASASVSQVWACTGCNQTINLTLDKTLGTAANVVGHTEASTSFNIGSIYTGYGGLFGSYQGASFSKIDGTLPPYPTAPGDWVYQPVDDYFSVAVRLRQTCGFIYAPFNRDAWAVNTCQTVSNGGPYWDSTTWDSSLKITRRLINGTYHNNIFIGRWGGCEGRGCARQALVYANVYLNYRITVPQTCVINAGQIVTVDFGNVSTGAFKAAGAKATGVNPIARNLGIKCSNIDAYANLTLRVQSDNVAGNIMVSGNKDVGFVITDGNDRPLTPNDFSSVLPFKIDGTLGANITIKVYPASVTGVKPAEGPVMSQGYLRIDFA